MKDMLRIVLAMVLIGVSGTKAQSPSSNQNYVMQSQVKVSGITSESQLNLLTLNQISRQINYYDGLGRSSQIVDWKASPGGYDVVSVSTYDSLGRLSKQYLPYKAGTDDISFKSSAVAAATSYYQASQPNVVQTSFPFSQIVYEKSSIEKVMEAGSPGVDWQIQSGHTVKAEYVSNTSQIGNYPVKIYKANPTSNQNQERELYEGGWYDANSLSVKIVKDENWVSGKGGTVETYADRSGKTLLKRKWKNSSECLSTYYVYDDFDRLCFVLSPLAEADNATITQNALDNFCRQFRYDSKGRITEKKMPGKGWEENVYNSIDQVVLSRDGNLQNSGKWKFNKYDILGRLIITGIISSNSSRTSWQNTIDTQTLLYESKDPVNASGAGTGYTNNVQPFHNVVQYYYTINYFDDYSFYGNSLAYNASGAVSNSTKGLQTAAKVNILNTNMMLLAVKYYDDESRAIESVSDNHLGGIDRIISSYDFSGQIINKLHTHSSNSSAVVVENAYEYNNNGRLIRNKQKTGSASSPQVILSQFNYNDVGQLISKKVHSENNGGSFLLDSIKNAYNERGWLTNTSSSLFAMQLKYQDGTTPQFNGNISNQLYGPGTLTKTFTYSYDKLNQLTSGSSSSLSETGITYDKGGNISSLTRDGNTLSYNYTYEGQPGYKLASLTATGLANQPYVYDANGNATTDGSRNISISYNVLDLPVSITGNGINVTYTYLATGERISKYNQVTGVTRDYISSIEYENGSIKTIKTEEGLARNNSGTYSYEYTIDDYQSNTRITFYKDPNTGLLTQLQSEEYYPYGLRVDPANLPSNVTNYLYAGKEFQEEFNEYDYGARFYDPLIGRWNVMDPANQFDDLTPYSGIGNNPIIYADPDGRFLHILIGAVVGGVVNLAIKAATGKIDSFKDGFVAFGIGAVAGGVGAATGGAALGATGFAARSIGGGLVTALGATAASSPILGLGNHVYFGDPYSLRSFGKDLLTAGVTGGILGGITSKAGTNIWTGAKKAIVDPGVAEISQFGNRIVGESSDIALGVTENLDDFATNVNGSTWKTWGLDDFQSQFLEKINNPGTKIHFNLTGAGGTMIDPWKAVTEGAKGLSYSRATSWELFQLYSNKAALSRTIFYFNGKIVANPF